MEIILLGSILLLRVVQSITGKACSKRMPSEPSEIVFYMSFRMAISALFAVILLMLSGGILGEILNMPTSGWLIACLTGITLTVSTICGLFAMRYVSVVLSSLFGAAGLLIPTIGGIFLYKQRVAAGQWIGILFLFAAAVLLAASSQKTNGKITPKAIGLLFGSMLANGSTMLLQTLFKNYVPNGNVSVYSFLQFAIPAVALFIAGMLFSGPPGTAIWKNLKPLTGVTLFASASLFGISQVSTIASAVIPLAVLFPISDGGHTVIAAIVAALIYKERFTVKNAFGILIGVSGLVMIKLLGV